ncbi:MAG TPA: response regulator [Candidatus Paceibacterota bacterium]
MKTILVVDDDPFQRELVDATLKCLGYQFLHATNGIDALEKLNAATGSDISMVITDRDMPGKNGIGLAMEIRARISEKLPILMITGHVGDETEKEALLAGINNVISKPFRLGDLREAVRELLESGAP